MRLYYSGRALWDGFWDGNGGTGLAILRRDGFASLEAGADGGILLTRRLVFSGAHLFVNLAAPTGRLRVAVLGEDGEAIDGFGLADCRPVSGDATRLVVRWADGGTLGALAGGVVRFRFELFEGALCAFWVSRWGTGESEGYVAAGGPGFPHGRDEPA